MNTYPEHEKLQAISAQSQAIGEFMAWLAGQGIILAKPHEHADACYDHNNRPWLCRTREGELYDVARSTERLLSEYFHIDLNKIELEKRAMLEELRQPQVSQ